MSNLIIPLPKGLTWNIQKKANWSTIIQRGYSGREVRSPLYTNPIWEWDMAWNYLYDYVPPAHVDWNPPSAPTLQNSSANPLIAIEYYCVITYVYPEGETQASPESSWTTAAGTCLAVLSPSDPGNGCLGWNVYVGLWSGGEVLQNPVLIPLGTNWTEDSFGLTSNPNTLTHYDNTETGYSLTVVPPAPPGPAIVIPNYDTVWQTLLGFYNGRQGSYDNFLFADPTDGFVFNQIGVGDGVTTQFQLTRTFGGFTEVIQNPLGPLQISFNTSPAITSGYSMSSTGLITFTSAPTLGDTINAYSSFFFRCRFTEDNLEGNNFMYNLFKLKSLKLMSVKL
jgi:hypothetical protein